MSLLAITPKGRQILGTTPLPTGIELQEADKRKSLKKLVVLHLLNTEGVLSEEELLDHTHELDINQGLKELLLPPTEVALKELLEQKSVEKL